MPIYRIEMKLCATAYVRAKSPAQAKKIAAALANEGLEAHDSCPEGIAISDKSYDDPSLPDVSLSPAMTCYGLFDPTDTPERADD